MQNTVNHLRRRTRTGWTIDPCASHHKQINKSKLVFSLGNKTLTERHNIANELPNLDSQQMVMDQNFTSEIVQSWHQLLQDVAQQHLQCLTGNLGDVHLKHLEKRIIARTLVCFIFCFLSFILVFKISVKTCSFIPSNFGYFCCSLDTHVIFFCLLLSTSESQAASSSLISSSLLKTFNCCSNWK